MSKEIPANVETIEVQKRIVRGVNSIPTYHMFHADHFTSSQWHKDLKWWADRQTNLDPAYFQLVGLVGIIAAQYGFQSLDYTSIRHTRGDWDRDPATPMHQVALGIEIANWGLQAYPVKEKIAQRFDEGTAGWWGAWNVFIKTRGHRVPRFEDLVGAQKDDLAKEAERRFTYGRKIALPDLDLNERVAAIPFTGDQADRMPTEKFVHEVLPRVVEATRDWTNPIPIFISDMAPGA